MIITVYIVDQSHPGEVPGTYRHVGTYLFEVDYAANPFIHALAAVIRPEGEERHRPMLNRLLNAADIPDATRASEHVLDTPQVPASMMRFMSRAELCMLLLRQSAESATDAEWMKWTGLTPRQKREAEAGLKSKVVRV